MWELFSSLTDKSTFLFPFYTVSWLEDYKKNNIVEMMYMLITINIYNKSGTDKW